MENKLKLCPFCGAKVTIMPSGAGMMEHDENCWVAQDYAQYTRFRDSCPIAIERWNRRIQEAEHGKV